MVTRAKDSQTVKNKLLSFPAKSSPTDAIFDALKKIKDNKILAMTFCIIHQGGEDKESKAAYILNGPESGEPMSLVTAASLITMLGVIRNDLERAYGEAFEEPKES